MRIMSGNTKCKVAYFSGGSRLPAEFQEVEYLESTGTQYIDTGISSTKNTNIKCLVNVSQYQNAKDVFGTGIGGIGNSLFILESGTSSWNAFITYNGNINFQGLNNLEIDFNDSNHKLIVNGSEIGTFNRYNNLSSNLPTMFIFTTGQRNVYSSQMISMKLYNFKVFESDILVRNFIPCYRKADNVAGLYDLVNGVFYTNAGTGTFTKGNNVQALAPLKCQVH